MKDSVSGGMNFWHSDCHGEEVSVLAYSMLFCHIACDLKWYYPDYSPTLFTKLLKVFFIFFPII